MERFQERSKAQNQGVLTGKSYHKIKDIGGAEKTWSKGGGECDSHKEVYWC